MRLRSVDMDFLYGVAFGAEPPEAYERLLLDAMLGDATLFTRRDEVEAQWRVWDLIWTHQDRITPATGPPPRRCG